VHGEAGARALPTRNLDLLRAVAVLCVLVAHLLTVLDLPLPDGGTTKLGRVGVLFFFVHTALVLMASIERQGAAGSGWVRDFYLRRAFRIYPLAIVTILLAVVFAIPEQLVVPAVGPTPLTARTLASNLALVQNLTADPNILGVLWTLPIEVQMYALLPACYLVAIRSSRAMVVLLLLFVLAGLIVSHVHVRGLARLSMLGFAPCFAGGVLAYHLLGRRGFPRMAAWTWPVAIVAAGAGAFVVTPSYAHPEVGWLPCLALGAVLPFIRDAAPSLVSRAAAEVCRVSYGIYLLHEPVLWLSFVVLVGAPVAARWVSFVVLIVALPTLAYRLVERPGIELGRRLTGRRVSSALEVGAP
jgi:peptidoglycan/LPS O-acetylase OafA/YrhL